MSRAGSLSIGALTDEGQVRDLNEDSIGTPERVKISDDLLARKGVLLAVADGMGGHAAGEVASQEAIRILYAEYYGDPSTDLPRSLRRAVKEVNIHLLTQAASDQGKQGMGTTLVAAVIRDDRLIVANVGDSRAYLFRDGALRQISRDHSWVAEALAADLITEEQARTHAYRNLITRALGQRPEVEVDLIQERLRGGDTLLLCSDGLTNEVDDAHIARVLSQGSPVESVRSLVILANRGGGRDNISAVVARVPSGRERLRSVPVTLFALGMLALIAAVSLAFALWVPAPWKAGGEVRRNQGLTEAGATTIQQSPSSRPTDASPPTSQPALTRASTSEPTPVSASSPAVTAKSSPAPSPSASSPMAVPGDGQPEVLEAIYGGEPVPQLRDIPLLHCLSGTAHDFKVADGSLPGAFLLTSNGEEFEVSVPPRDLSRQCRPLLDPDSEVTACWGPATSNAEGHGNLAEVIVLWSEEDAPILWLLPAEGEELFQLSRERSAVDELLKLTDWEEELRLWLQEQDLEEPPGFLNEPVLAYTRWGQQGNDCRLQFELMPMEGGESGAFFWDGEYYVHYAGGGAEN